MPSKRRLNNIPKPPLDRQFDSVQEAAKAKTEHVLSTVFKNADWDSLKNR
jgi:hypothetical protein